MSWAYLDSMKKLKFLFLPTIFKLVFGLFLSCAKTLQKINLYQQIGGRYKFSPYRTSQSMNHLE